MKYFQLFIFILTFFKTHAQDGARGSKSTKVENTNQEIKVS
jgi:hypothetical protein